jgi:hypothetical protein
MVTFLTLLLGLVVGEQKVELAVDDRVASVEVWLDGAIVGVLRGPPWSITCDFGKRLAPHLLEAVARDSGGREMDRAVQRVNLPRAPAEVSLALHGGEHGYRAVEIAWSSPGKVNPEEMHLFFDGEPLEVSGPLVALPPHDPKTTHVISVELIFPRQVRATAGLAFGGEFGEDVSSELTAVSLEPDVSTGDRRLPSAEQVETWLRAGGATPRVVAVERGPFELFVVRDGSSFQSLRGLGAKIRAGVSSARKDAFHFVASRPHLARGADGSWFSLFPVSTNVNATRAGLPWALTHVFFKSHQQGRNEELTGAVAVAGVEAAGSRRPRGLLLVRGAGPIAESKPGLDPVSVREYLSALRVPFFYWRIDENDDATPDSWGTPTIVRGVRDLRRAESELAAALRPQFLAWLDGSHMPDQVTTTPAASTLVRLAGEAHDESLRR